MSAEHWRLSKSETLKLFNLRKTLAAYYRRKVDANDVEALTMDTLVEAGARFEGRATLQHFVFAIARNMVAEHWRRSARRNGRGELVFELERFENVDVMRDPGTGLDSLLIRCDRQDLIDSALATVAESYREVVQLWLEGLDNFQIAVELGLNYNTVRSRLSRGKAMLLGAYREGLEL